MSSDATRSKELVLELANEPGTLGRLAQILGKEQINILGFAAVAANDAGKVHLITDDPKRAEEVLQESGHVPQSREAIVVTIPDQPGALGRLANKLGTAGVNIEASFITASVDGHSVRCAFSVDDVDTAVEVVDGLD